MYQYCTLQEAYNVPTFARKKKGCMPMEPNASAEPYDPYTEQRGKEHAIMERFENSSTPSSKPQARQDQFGFGGDRVTYKSMESDYDYYCKNYGICALEKFTNATKPTPPPLPKKDKCAPLSPPNYEYPISDADKAKFQAALKIALEQMENSTPPPSIATPMERPTSSASVTGFVDDELETYMKLHDMKAEPKITALPTLPSQTAAPKELPGFDRPDKLTPFEKDTQKNLGYNFDKSNLSKLNFTKSNAHWMDLILFVVTGFLVIFLLEQMYKVSMMIGMKRTLQAMDHLMMTARQTRD